ncbi:DUF3263 domain-containing protein [Sphaerisporangium sp. TRM90804]|uniref:DUF3263 domain-containing protein n=1 Tax=Sphaerisporangium sp. TRM90804 TaxID=3031113 RepID=UPI00244A3F30|nr:DUF3263 domain-containing protein [Sphaerisporangium sp. TRM90804]MDH2430428.1 DUF3263 domain-containing protein [Sphaerisporangium sp. TRM90804]
MDTAPEHGDADPEDLPAPHASGELTARERELLAFERQWWRHAGAKEQAIRETFGISATRYYQLLGRLVERPEALAHDPMTVKRLRRLRASRRRERAARRLGMRP